MAPTIKHKRSLVPAKIPTTEQLEIGALAINAADKILYTKNSAGDIVAINDWANVQNKPDVGAWQGSSALFTGNTAPNVNTYSFWWNTSTNTLWTAVNDSVNPRTWVETVTPQPGAELHTSSTYLRERLTTERIYYVATNGSNSNTGLTETTPFATIQKAIDTVAALDISTGSVIIQLADGTYNESVTLKHIVGADNTDIKVTIQGNLSNMSAVTVNAVSNGCFYSAGTTNWIIRNIKVTCSVAGTYCIIAAFNSVIRFLNIDFGSATAGHIGVYTGSLVEAIGAYVISGDGQYHIYVTDVSEARIVNTPVTLNGTRNFSTAFCGVSRLSLLYGQGATFTGSAVGSRYSVDRLGIISVGGAALTFFPGNIAGTTSTGGIYN